MVVRKILSLDGGGIRGAATAQFLMRLEEDLGKSLYDTFDLFAGTSTGGIIAGLLALLRKRGNELPDIYNYENANRIMDKSRWDRIAGSVQTKPIYDGVGKRKVLDDYFSDMNLNSAQKPILIVTYDVEKRKSEVLKSRNNNVRAVDALDATSAAPLYFPTVEAEVDNETRWLIDGGVIANNPTICAYVESKKQWPDDEIRMLSVGTGKRTRKIVGKASQDYGAFGWITHDLIGITMDESVVEYQAEVLLGKNYLRVNSELTKESGVNDDMDDVSQYNIDKLKALGEKWYADFGANARALLLYDSVN